jgi:RNA polymerase sigma-70 factor (ECF subfamily)
MKARPPRSDVPVEDGPQLPDPSPDPEDNWMADQRKRLVYAALAQVSEPNREMILLKEIQGLNLQEIAALLAIPLGTVKSRSNRARLELARAIITLDPTAG